MTFFRASCCECVSSTNPVAALEFNFPSVTTKASHCDVDTDTTCDCIDESDYNDWSCYSLTYAGWSGESTTNDVAWTEILETKTINDFNMGWFYALIKSPYTDASEESSWCCGWTSNPLEQIRGEVGSADGGKYEITPFYTFCNDNPFGGVGALSNKFQAQATRLQLRSALELVGSTWTLSVEYQITFCMFRENIPLDDKECEETLVVPWRWTYQFPLSGNECFSEKASTDADVTLVSVDDNGTSDERAHPTADIATPCGISASAYVLHYPFHASLSGVDWCRGVYIEVPTPSWTLKTGTGC
jgi:hypothetical protein